MNERKMFQNFFSRNNFDVTNEKCLSFHPYTWSFLSSFSLHASNIIFFFKLFSYEQFFEMKGKGTNKFSEESIYFIVCENIWELSRQEIFCYLGIWIFWGERRNKYKFSGNIWLAVLLRTNVWHFELFFMGWENCLKFRMTVEVEVMWFEMPWENHPNFDKKNH